MGKVVEYMPSCHSTNDSARELLSKPDTPEGTIVITDHQIAGRGQRGNSWFSSEGMNLTFSVILRPSFLSISRQFYLNMVTSMAVQRAIKHFIGESTAAVKWPNDVLLNGKKACGILIENSVRSGATDSSIIGIGLNVNQRNFGLERATSLATEAGRPFLLQAVLDNVLGQLEGLYLKLKAEKYTEIKEAYLQDLVGYKQWRKYRTEHLFDGEIVGVMDSGKLQMHTTQGERCFDFKEVEFIWN